MPLMEDWRKIESFKDYSVSNLGRVKNDVTGRVLAVVRDRNGSTSVGLFKDRHLHRRSLSLLVATAFLKEPRERSFNCPINLDGNRSNNQVDNLMWRPRWFAIKYTRQFHDEWSHYPDYIYPVEEVNTKQRFDSCWEASTTQGILVHDVHLSTETDLCVWPTRQTFRSCY